MATTRLVDVIVPEVFYPYMVKQTMEKSAIFQSGVMRHDPAMAAFLAGGGTTVNVPFWNDLTNSEPLVVTDNPADVGVPAKIGSGKDVARRQIRANGWSAARLSAELAGSDPMKAIGDRVSNWWMRYFQRNMVASLHGVYLDNVANDAGDMTLDVGTDAVGAAVATELISAEAVIDAKQTLGDASDQLAVIIMHSVVYARLQKQNLIDFIPDSRGEIKFPTYLGYRVVVDDGVKKVVGVNRTKYVTYLLGTGAMLWADSPVAKPIGLEEEEAQGNGMGVETLWTRRQFMMHPYGIKWTETAVLGNFPTDAELATVTNWDRVYAERKQVPIAFLLTNG